MIHKQKISNLFSEELLLAYLEGDQSACDMNLEDFFYSVEVRWEEIRTDSGYDLLDAVADVLRDPIYRLRKSDENPCTYVGIR